MTDARILRPGNNCWRSEQAGWVRFLDWPAVDYHTPVDGSRAFSARGERTSQRRRGIPAGAVASCDPTPVVTLRHAGP
jgi:hypothetical protein